MTTGTQDDKPMTDIVLSEQTGPVRILTLNRPERLNAINPGLVTAFRLALEDANTDENTRVIVLLGEKYDAQALLDLGIAWRVVPESMVKETAFEAAERIASLPTTAVRLFKKTFNQAIFMDLEETLEAEIQALVASVMDSGTADRVSSFDKK
jgi:enoyl-CoA hydratase/carnithine racemase